jgi:transcription elongation GreA/GreB family factor
MDKQKIIDALLAKLETERNSLAEAAQHTYEAATHEESEAEDQYDTRGLEASYLAGAQAKRVAEVEKWILSLKHMKAKNFGEDDVIGATALVELDHEGKTTYCFLLPIGGGQSVDLDGHHIQVVTPLSPMGEALVGRAAGDVALVEIGDETREYEIVSVS